MRWKKRAISVGRRLDLRLKTRTSRERSWLAPEQPLALYPLISPLRYDILARLDYVSFFLERRDLFESDFGRYLQEARTLPYYVWYSRVSKHGRRHAKSSDDGFAKRTLAVASLVDSFAQNGYDHSKAIIVRTGDVVLPTATGKYLGRKYFAGDGCHRLALLLLMGRRYLQPDEYRIARYSQYVPVDDTASLVPLLRPSESEYISFLSLGYCGDEIPFTRARDLLSWMDRSCPQKLDEVRSILKIDGMADLIHRPPSAGGKEVCAG